MFRVKISDLDASQYPFSDKFQMGDIVEKIGSGRMTRGKITDAEYEGHPKEHKGGNYSVTYTIETDDGSCYNAKELELKKINQ